MQVYALTGMHMRPLDTHYFRHEGEPGTHLPATYADLYMRRLRAWIGRPQTSPRHDHRQGSCSVTVPQPPPGSPSRGGWRITAKAYHESFLQVKAL